MNISYLQLVNIFRDGDSDGTSGRHFSTLTTVGDSNGSGQVRFILSNRNKRVSFTHKYSWIKNGVHLHQPLKRS